MQAPHPAALQHWLFFVVGCLGVLPANSFWHRWQPPLPPQPKTAFLAQEHGQAAEELSALPPPSDLPDQLAQATVQLNSQFHGRLQRAGAQQKPPLLSKALCELTAANVGATSCSLVTVISGTPEGCECRVEAEECPPADTSLGFTGVSPSATMVLPQMGGTSLTLCMYWQWHKKPDRSAAVAKAAAQVKDLANQFVKTAYVRAGAVKGLANALWSFTPVPPPVPSAIPYPPTMPFVPRTVLFPETTTYHTTTPGQTTTGFTTTAPNFFAFAAGMTAAPTGPLLPLPGIVVPPNSVVVNPGAAVPLGTTAPPGATTTFGGTTAVGGTTTAGVTTTGGTTAPGTTLAGITAAGTTPLGTTAAGTTAAGTTGVGTTVPPTTPFAR